MRWIIPDIHGCFQSLRALLEEQIRPSKGDALFFLGDYIDRGPASRQVIEYLMKMQSDGYQLRLLKGNHEEFCLMMHRQQKAQKWYQRLAPSSQIWHNWMKQGGDKTLNSYGVKRADQIPAEHIEWMARLENFIELEDFILVHAGFNFAAENIFTDQKSMLWIREFVVEPEKCSNKKIIHGHVPVSMQTIRFNLANDSYASIDLDNGVYKQDQEGYGNLVAFNPDTKAFLVQQNRDF